MTGPVGPTRTIEPITYLDTMEDVAYYNLPTNPIDGYTETVRLLYKRSLQGYVDAPMGRTVLSSTNNVKTFRYDSTTDPNNPTYRILGDIDSFYPTVQQGSKLVGTGYIGSPLQGCSTAISSDGNTLALGVIRTTVLAVAAVIPLTSVRSGFSLEIMVVGSNKATNW